MSEERRQQSSELSEQLKLRVSENSAMRLDLDELRKRLEMADVMLQQVDTHTPYTLSLSFVLWLFNSLCFFIPSFPVSQGLPVPTSRCTYYWRRNYRLRHTLLRCVCVF